MGIMGDIRDDEDFNLFLYELVVKLLNKKVYTEKEETDGKDELGILIRGAGEGLSWYAQGKLGSGLWKGLHAAKQIGFGESVNLIKGAAQNAWTTLKTQGLKTTVSNALTKANTLSFSL